MNKKQADNSTKINAQFTIIEKALEKIKKLSGGEPTIINLDLNNCEIVLVKRVWAEHFIDEDTGLVVSVERKMNHVVLEASDKGILKVI